MNVRILIDGIVRQTTVLIAQLATSAGVRAPLARVADQVFFDLAREIEAQGVTRKVVADMFGLALRSYQKKMHRLAASETDTTQTLWQAVLTMLQQGAQTRERLLERFRYDGEREVGAVLADLVSSGLVYTSGSGTTTVYGVLPDADLRKVTAAQDREAVTHVAWLRVFRQEALTEAALAAVLGVDAHATRQAVETLIADGRLERRTDGTLRAGNVVIPVGSAAGWEAAVLDHHRAVSVAIAAKVNAGVATAAEKEIGGTTLTFRVPAGHPHEERVRGLLVRIRAEVAALWDEVASYNTEHPPPEDCPTVTFYFGQNVTQGEAESAEPNRPTSEPEAAEGNGRSSRKAETR